MVCKFKHHCINHHFMVKKCLIFKLACFEFSCHICIRFQFKVIRNLACNNAYHYSRRICNIDSTPNTFLLNNMIKGDAKKMLQKLLTVRAFLLKFSYFYSICQKIDTLNFPIVLLTSTRCI